MEHSSCGVGFLVSLNRAHTHEHLLLGLKGLLNMEHRGGTDLDGRLGDGAGIMTDIPWELFEIEPHSMAVATLFCPQDKQKYEKSLQVFEQTFGQFGLVVKKYREVPVNLQALGERAKENMPRIIQAFIKRPVHCRTMASFDKMLYFAKQMTRVNQKEAGIVREFYFTSLSCRTIIYKALSTGEQLSAFYQDLNNPTYKTSLAMFHRRFSTNTLSSWDKVQPFRLIAHNGEINTIEGNVSAAITREKSLGLRVDELITHKGSSDSGNMNGMVEALKYRSSIPNLAEILAIMIPPAGSDESDYFQFWSRAMEPWDGPALVAFSDGKRIGARLDRNGFRPCRWMRTENAFFLSSEAGCFEIAPSEIRSQGALHAGRCVSIHVLNGEVSFSNPDNADHYKDAKFDPRLKELPFMEPKNKNPEFLKNRNLFYYTKEDLSKVLIPMIVDKKEPIGSMGDTSRLASLSTVHRTIYDYFYQNFAQVTNPPLDYIREKMVTELKVYLGRKPNIFEPKELIPPPEAIEASGPVLSLGQMEYIKQVRDFDKDTTLKSETFDILFERDGGVDKFHEKIESVVAKVVQSVRDGVNIVTLSDREASYENLPIPAILVMRAVQLQLNREGLRLRISLIVDSGEVRDAHQVAALIGFGASAVCPYMALETARYED
ncbi:MAG: glutamate synthase central domain-containing protein, partial [Bacteriovoracaceae bacterium]